MNLSLTTLLKEKGYKIFAGFSTLSLIFSTFALLSTSRSINEVSKDLKPISTWAKSQNSCIEKTFRIDGKNMKGLPSKVWSCNGGGD